MDMSVDWSNCIEDIWRLSALYLVAEGRNAALYKVPSMTANIAGLEPFLKKTEYFLTLWAVGKQECILSPECVVDNINPVNIDCFVDSTLVVLTGENRPDLALWIESLLKAYCFITSGTEVESIQLVNPYRGSVATLETIPIGILHKLYCYIFDLWSRKQG